MPVASNKIGNQVLKALGLEGRAIAKLVLTMETNCAVEVQITEMVEQDGAEEIVEVLSDFYLTKKPDAKG